jgi:hypothetical protein
MTMKKILTYLSILTAVFLFTPNTAEARTHSHCSSSYVSGHSSCGCPIYTKKVFTGNDCYGRPMYRYYRQAASCSCNRYNYRSSSRYTSSRHYSHRGYNSNNSCNNNSRYSNSRRSRSHGYYNGGSRLRVTYCR